MSSMRSMHNPIPLNEIERVRNLLQYDIDYTDPKVGLDDLTQLAAYIVGAEISLVNLIDNYTQWTLSSYGIDAQQMPREDSVCQYTILEKDHFETKDMSTDKRFKDKSYVTMEKGFRHYYGIPLKSREGLNLGALCLVTTSQMEITPEKAKWLRLIARQVMQRLEELHTTKILRQKIRTLNHDIRSPIGGIVAMSQLLREQINDQEDPESLLDSIQLIEESGNNVLELTNQILSEPNFTHEENLHMSLEWDLPTFKAKLLALYSPQAIHKEVKLNVQILHPDSSRFPAKDLLQICGNLIANSIKFSEKDDCISVILSIDTKNEIPLLDISVQDTGQGMSPERVNKLKSSLNPLPSTQGTAKEQGYGHGLQIVKECVHQRKGKWDVSSVQGKGTQFRVSIPLS